MSRYFAFLRAINVGGHTVKMDRLRQLFEGLGFARVETAAALNIAFLAEALDDGQEQRLMALRTAIDDFHVHGREIYWLCRRKQSESTFSNAVLEKTLGRQSTLRGMNTVQRMAAKFA